MNSFHSMFSRTACAFLFVGALSGTLLQETSAADASALVDNYSDPAHTAGGGTRLIITDKDLGGHSQATQSCKNGVLQVQGELVPGRGRPGFVSLVSVLEPTGQSLDASRFQGVRLHVKVIQGTLAVQVCSSEIQNYDYHTSAPLIRDPQQFQEVRIPFASLKRQWSEPLPLNPKTLTSVNLVAVGMAPGAFAYEIDSLGFY